MASRIIVFAQLQYFKTDWRFVETKCQQKKGRQFMMPEKGHQSQKKLKYTTIQQHHPNRHAPLYVLKSALR